MANKVIMPKLGLTMEKGKLTRWLKDEGEKVEKGEVLFEVESDKSTVQVEAEHSGVLLKKLYEEGDDVAITEIVAWIGEEGEEVPEVKKEEPGEVETSQTEKDTQAKKETKGKTKKSKDKKIKTSPIARRLAKENDIELEQINGTGPGGRITKNDISEYLENSSQVTEQKVKEKNLSKMRNAISKSMTESFKNIPQVTETLKADMTAAERMKNNIPLDLKINYTDILLKVVSKAIEKHKVFNSKFEEDKLVEFESINLGLAISVEEGLIAPVIKNVNNKSLKEISEERKELVKRAKNNNLKQEQLSGASFTITNLGMLNIEIFTPIVIPGQSGILGVGQIKNTPVVNNETKEIEVKPTMWLSLVFDHRVTDGAPAAQFLLTIQKYLEEPSLLLLE